MARNMATTKRPKDRRLSDQAEVARLHCLGRPLRAIAETLGLPLTTVFRDLTAAREQWQRDMAGYAGRAVAEELAKLAVTEAEAWAGWEASRKPAERTTTRTTAGGRSAGATETTVETRGQAGDPRFLERVGACIARRCQLLALDGAVKLELTGADGGPMQHQLELTDRERLKVMTSLAERLGVKLPPAFVAFVSGLPPEAPEPAADLAADPDQPAAPPPSAGGPYEPGTPAWLAL
jgi:hypothetical protein